MTFDRPNAAVIKAEAFAEDQNPQAGYRILLDAADAGDAEACFRLGLWFFVGRRLPRKLNEARHWFERAGALGHQDANVVFNGFLATGTGGSRDWPRAMALLKERASTDTWAARELALIDAMGLSPEGDAATPIKGEQIAERPNVILFRDFLRPEECVLLAQLAAPLLKPSTVIEPRTGLLVQNPIRTSDACAFPLMSEGPFISIVNRRIAQASGTAPEQGEPLQVLRYRAGQEYRAHFDALPYSDNQRIKTVLLYLDDGYAGGKTTFVRTGLSISGRTGDALMFQNTLPDGTIDPLSLHAGEPVLDGVKLLASRWIRARPIDLMAPPSRA
ncbi:MAG TPA: 2OG-Fe(II) oxygenase [Sphingomonas sp.]|nr:2OG-Fe(II) oxygenase [Sphingomonas sp.]